MIYFLKHFFGAKNMAYRYDQLFSEIKVVQPKNIMEIGVWTGERSRKMIKIAKKYNPTNSINYYGFDLFEPMDEKKYNKEMSKQPPEMLEVENKLKKTGVHINLFKGDTHETLPKIHSNLPGMDFVFIDGGHSLETIANDWHYISTLIRPGGVVIFDDYWPDRIDAGSKITVDAIDRKEYGVTILPVIDSFDDTSFGPLEIQFAKVVKL